MQFATYVLYLVVEFFDDLIDVLEGSIGIGICAAGLAVIPLPERSSGQLPRRPSIADISVGIVTTSDKTV
jgi:hypothetical protein